MPERLSARAAHVRRLALAVLVLLALAGGASASPGPEGAARALNVADHLDCTRAGDATPRLRALLEAGGPAAGRTLLVPSGCRLLLGSPGAGRAVANVASGTTIRCEDASAGFLLARRSCDEASATPGAACTSDDQCKGGACAADDPNGSSFAPDEASTYTVFGAAAGTSGQAIEKCGFWVNGGSGDGLAMGGSGKRWGWCDGAGTSVRGAGCFDACNDAAGPKAGFACVTDADCGGVAGSCVARAGDCRARGGACTVAPYATSGGASGAGKVNVIAWGSAARAHVDGVTVYDHRRGDASIAVGADGRILDSSTIGNDLPTAQFGGIVGPTLAAASGTIACASSPRCLAATVAEGIVAGAGSTVERSVGYGWTAGIHARGGNRISASTGGGYGDPSQPGWRGNADLLISNAGVVATGFRGGSSLYCVLPEFNSGYNFIVQGAYCDGNLGPKFIVQNAGNQYLGVRAAWHGRGAVIGLGDQRGRCAAGPRAGQVCVFGANDDPTIGCPAGSCQAHADFKAGSSNHFIVGGGSLLQSQLGKDVAFLRTTDAKRCVNPASPLFGAPCAGDRDCTSGSCDYLTWANGLIDGVLLYGGAGATAFDLATSAVGVSRSGGPSISNWLISGAALRGFATGFRFPPNARSCTGGLGGASNNGTPCASDATCQSTCSGGGKAGGPCRETSDCPGGACGGAPRCRGPVVELNAMGDLSDVSTPLRDWDWSYGDVSGLRGLPAAGDQAAFVTLVAAEPLRRGQLVSVSPMVDRAVAKATAGGAEAIVGVALADAPGGSPAKIQIAGVGACVAGPLAVSRGAALVPSPSDAGAVEGGRTGASSTVIGAALEPAAANETFACLVGGTGPSQK